MMSIDTTRCIIRTITILLTHVVNIVERASVAELILRLLHGSIVVHCVLVIEQLGAVWEARYYCIVLRVIYRDALGPSRGCLSCRCGPV